MSWSKSTTVRSYLEVSEHGIRVPEGTLAHTKPLLLIQSFAHISTPIMFSRSALCALAAAFLASGAQSFSVDQSRRNALVSVSKGAAAFLVGAPALTSLPEPSFAAAVPTTKELERLPLGLARVRYLLDHWDDITTKCGSNPNDKQVVRTEGGGGGFCDRTPLRVQEFLGYKSTEDPLFKADKLMLRAAPLVDPDSFEDYLSVVEKYREKGEICV